MSYLGNMFTGIVETTGVVKEVITNASNRSFWIESPISSQCKVDQSVNHSGVCLTIEEISQNRHYITAIDETLKKTNLDGWEAGTLVNLERCLRLNDRVDGHLVQGHADATGICLERKEKKGSYEFVFGFPKKFASQVIEKGSICLNGISLTAFNVKRKTFSTAIIPYTFDHTNINQVREGDHINLEFDMIGKYLIRRLSLSEGLLRRKRNN